jgi:prevent-host-death family protein
MQVNMHDAKTRLSKLVQAALDGEEVVIARNGKPVARITKYAPAKFKRKPGSLKGKIWFADDWDSPETRRMINDLMIPEELRPRDAETQSAMQPQAPHRASAAGRGAKRRRRA